MSVRPLTTEGAPTVDWGVATSTALRLLRSGPDVSKAEAAQAVRDLRQLNAEAEELVRELTGLGAGLPYTPAAVVDRPGWVRAAADGLSGLLDTAMSTGGEPVHAGGALGGMAAGTAGMQAGLVLAYLGSKVLGQYDPFAAPAEPGGEPGRLLLVAPNVVSVQQALDVDARDFRMWVCLHECTHRLQFTAVPWLREYFVRGVGELLGDMDESVSEALSRLPQIVRSARERKPGSEPGVLGLVELFQSPEQRAAMDRIIALSTLLEGHADYVMDAVGPRVVPSVHTIRSRFTERRRGGGVLDRTLRALLGVDAKVQQYALGSAFTRYVVDRVGMESFNAVWQAPVNLPTRAEITEPEEWIRRVHG